jgi:hypothetical protein
VDWQGSATTTVLQLLGFVTIVDPYAIDSLHCDEVSNVQLAELFQPSACEPSKER